MTSKKEILFVCVENAGRSQMAEAFFKKIGPKNYEAFSAGTKPASQVNPIVIEVMKEVGIDISSHKPKVLSEKIIPHVITVNMGCMDKEGCPALYAKNIIDWHISDPKGKSLEEVRKIRDNISNKIKELALTLNTES